MINPKKVKAEKECPLGKLKPVTFCINGCKGLGRLKISFTKNNKAVPLKPMAAMFKDSLVFFFKKRKKKVSKI